LFVFVSHPVEGLLSQLPKPALHAPSVHAPPGQVSVAFARLQLTLQSPQSVSVAVLRSQPLFGLPSQLLKFAAQLGTQAPAVQAVVPFVLVHCVVHVPQVATVLSDASQPLLC